MSKTINQIRNGLDIPLTGKPDLTVIHRPQIKSVGVVGNDFVDLKPTMRVSEGDSVKIGQPLLEDKKNPGVIHTSPGCGRVTAIHRGEKRRFLSLTIELDGEDETEFQSYEEFNLENLSREEARENLIASGLWTAIRTRPYSKAPRIDSVPHSIFVTAIDTNPLAPDPAAVLEVSQQQLAFVNGLRVLTTQTDGQIHLCCGEKSKIPGQDEEKVQVSVFLGPHPAGLAGTHIHLLDPVNEAKTVWHIGYQDVAAIGHLFMTGQLLTARHIALTGPGASNPGLVQARLGANLNDLVENQLTDATHRVISGSVLSGRKSEPQTGFLGRFHNQVTIIPEGGQRELLGWVMPGFQRFSVTRAFASAFVKTSKATPFTTSTEGNVRAVVPIGTYEKIMPLDIIATPLLKSLLVQDTETAQALGCLELDEEDLALCTFVCPGKNEYGPLLRQSLSHIEKEG